MAIMAENGVVSSENHIETRTDIERSNGNHMINNGEKNVVKEQNLSVKLLNSNGVSHVQNDVVEEKSEENYNEVLIENRKNDYGLDEIKKNDDAKKVDSFGDHEFMMKNGVTHVQNGVIEEKSEDNNHVMIENGGNEYDGDEIKKTKNDNVEEDDSFDDEDDVSNDNHEVKMKNGGEEGFKKEIRDLEESLSKLNPMAKEFVPPSLSNGFGYVKNMVIQPNVVANGYAGRRRRNNYSNGKKKMNSRTSMAQREEVIRRTVYVSDIDQQVTEEQLASLFINCGQVVDCRVCGDPNSVLRFAFIEFTNEEAAKNALILSGTMLGFYPVRVLPSKTAIAPVNPTFLPRSEDEREMCARTIYCTNIDKKVTQADLKLFFETFCGEVYRLRMLGDYHHSTRIAFVEFVMAESAIFALNCSGAVLGTLPIRVSPSKTPVRPRPPRSP